jgi:hypothetical protein
MYSFILVPLCILGLEPGSGTQFLVQGKKMPPLHQAGVNSISGYKVYHPWVNIS